MSAGRRSYTSRRSVTVTRPHRVRTSSSNGPGHIKKLRVVGLCTRASALVRKPLLGCFVPCVEVGHRADLGVVNAGQACAAVFSVGVSTCGHTLATQIRR